MRIIAGKYRSRIIEMPGGKRTRPTQDRVRESIFNILSTLCAGAKVLDLYSGSGAFGIEALSRGAKEAYFLDNDIACIQTIKKNLKALNILDNVFVIKLDAIKAIKSGLAKEQFDIIFLDPPYYKGLIEKTLLAIDSCDIIRNSGVIVAEHSKKDKIPEHAGKLGSIRQSVYGDTAITFYKVKG